MLDHPIHGGGGVGGTLGGALGALGGALGALGGALGALGGALGADGVSSSFIEKSSRWTDCCLWHGPACGH